MSSSRTSASGLLSAARTYLKDTGALQAARELDRQREGSLAKLRDAFAAFRAGDERFSRLVRRIEQHVTQVHHSPAGGAPVNLWGFRSEAESRFAARYAELEPRLPGLDLGAELRSYLEDPSEDEERVQLVLAFGELVAGIDARGLDPEPLGLGPAAHFLTFAWHCLSDGREPVFTWSSDRAVRLMERAGALRGVAEPPLREWEDRLRAFYAVSRGLVRGVPELTRGTRPGWALEHFLAWALQKLEQGDESPFAGGGDGPAPAPPAERSRPEPARPATAPATPPRGGGSDRVSQITGRKGKVTRVDPTPLERSGVPLEDLIGPDEVGARPPSRTSYEPQLAPRRGESAFKTAAQILREQREREEAELTDRLRRLAEESSDQIPALVPARGGGVAREEQAPVPVAALLSEYRGEVAQPAAGGDAAVSPVLTARLAHELHLDTALCEELLAVLYHKGRALLVGPPLSGKTWVARRLASHAAGNADRVLFLRVHPELRYQALMDDGGQPGLVANFCERAHQDRDHRHVIVLDELDRGDAARALGELLGALSERGERVKLGSGLEFTVPPNLIVIATARELPHDPALQGRFPTISFPANPAVLRSFLLRHRPSYDWAAEMLAELNARLAEGGHPLQVGHGLLMDPDLDALRLARIWRLEVLPLLEAAGIDPHGLDYDALRPRS